MFSFFKKKQVKTNGGSGLLPKEIVDEIKGGRIVSCVFGKDRALIYIRGETLFLANKGKTNAVYKESWRTSNHVNALQAHAWVTEGKLPARTKKKK